MKCRMNFEKGGICGKRFYETHGDNRFCIDCINMCTRLEEEKQHRIK